MKRYIEIGVNLTDSMFKGVYGGKVKHEEDIPSVINRAVEVGVERMVLLCGSLTDSIEGSSLCQIYDNLFFTVGCHPTNCNELLEDTDSYIESLRKIAINNDKVVAIGECGLDYDREHFCPRKIQVPSFKKQVQLAIDLNLPLYLHCRSAHDDLIKILKEYSPGFAKDKIGVVHTFDGTLDQANVLLNLGFYLGINGCSLKSSQNLEVVKELPLNRLLLETDSPWCEIRPSHAGYKFIKTLTECNKKEKWSKDRAVKGRNEPMNIVQVFEVLCGIRAEHPEVILETIFENSKTLFWRKKD